MTDPRHDPRLSEPVTRRPASSGGLWGWIAGLTVLVLIAIILIAGWNSNTHTASNPSSLPSATTGSAAPPAAKTPMASKMQPATKPPEATTGSAPASSPGIPVKPATPAGSHSGTQ
jgi:hypothetical protein